VGGVVGGLRVGEGGRGGALTLVAALLDLSRASATICAIVRQSLARARFASMLFRVEKAEGVEHGARNLGTFAAAAAQLA